MIHTWAPVWIYTHLLYVIVWAHFMMDFICQRWMKNAILKKQVFGLATIYALPFLFFGPSFAFVALGGWYFVTSRLDGDSLAIVYIRQTVLITSLLHLSHRFFMVF